MKQVEVIVVGGGASGLMAAGQAALAGARVLILEKKEKPGKKLRITGKGRCNLTNIAPRDEFITHFGENGKFLRQAFAVFFSGELISFFNQLGIKTNIERGGRVFPENDDAVAVTKALVNWVRGCSVKVENNARVDKLLITDRHITGVICNNKKITAGSVIIATGGASYPATGSSGDGYLLAKSAGHKIIPPRPALVPLVTDGDIAPRLQGLSLRNVEATVRIEGRKKCHAFGEMLFTHFGLSGPIILTLSGLVVDALRDKKKVTVHIDLKPALDEKKLDNRLLRDFKTFGKRQFHTYLKELLPQSLVPVGIKLTGIAPDKEIHHITAEERRRLRGWLKDFMLVIKGHRSFAEAIITAGGVCVKEVDPRTMASRLVKGLYFAGEVMDINGDTGGYNLQAAFSTGWLAGHSAAER
ncbi:MAG: NAD(P)/FAD-dependent oxidoreductase [candidate division Zixibacteria bacterium]|nr:NAD(P)/FAD-dependent oxidoreductase [candidate division Zixibacteria bacterium]MDD5425147.1 NAD(P)/FAD-dependent oxidoreductase [candidate division Zixibacteria bacterium]